MDLAGLLAWLLLNTFPWRLERHSGMKIQQVNSERWVVRNYLLLTIH